MSPAGAWLLGVLEKRQRSVYPGCTGGHRAGSWVHPSLSGAGTPALLLLSPRARKPPEEHGDVACHVLTGPAAAEAEPKGHLGATVLLSGYPGPRPAHLRDRAGRAPRSQQRGRPGETLPPWSLRPSPATPRHASPRAGSSAHASDSKFMKRKEALSTPGPGPHALPAHGTPGAAGRPAGPRAPESCPEPAPGLPSPTGSRPCTRESEESRRPVAHRPAGRRRGGAPPAAPTHLLLQHLRPLLGRRQLPRRRGTLADPRLQLPVEPGDLLPHQPHLGLRGQRPPQLSPQLPHVLLPAGVVALPLGVEVFHLRTELRVGPRAKGGEAAAPPPEARDPRGRPTPTPTTGWPVPRG